MATKINYGTKAPFQDKPEIPVTNKVTADNMNEIKEAVNGNADELDTAKEDIENLQSGQGTNNTDITDLKNRVTTLEGDNKTNKTNIDNLRNNKVDKVEGKGLSTEDYTTAEKQKLAGLNNYNDTEIKQDISDIKKEQQTQNNNIKNLQKNDAQQDKSIETLQKENTELKEECSRLRQDLNAFPSGQAEGEYITLQDSADSRFNKFVIGGNSKQDTRSGKNKLNVIASNKTESGITFTNNKDGSITINGTNTSGGTIYYDLNKNTKSYFNLTKGNTYGLLLKNTVNGLNLTVRTVSKNYPIITTGNGVEEIVKEYSDETDNECYAYISVAAGATINNVTVYPMLVEGSEIGEWEQYGAMPSPEYPSTIQNVEGNVNITVCNKNLCYKSIVSNNDNINFYFNTKSIAKEVAISFIVDKSLKGNSIYCKANGVSIGRILARVTANANEKVTAQITFTDEEHEKVKNANEVYFQLYKAGANFETINEPMIENSPTATDYVEHQEQNFLFPLAEGQRLMKGDYLADDGIHHVRKQIELNGTENWQYRNTNSKGISTFSLSIVEPDYKRYDGFQAICSHFKNLGIVSVVSEMYYNDEGFSFFYNADFLALKSFYINTSQQSNLANFKNWLVQQKEAGTPVILEYELAEEEIEAYTPEQQEAYNKIVQTAKSYKNVTNIFSTDTVSPVFEVNYRKDIETMLEQVQAQTNAINELLSTTKTSAILLDNLQSDLESEVM